MSKGTAEHAGAPGRLGPVALSSFGINDFRIIGPFSPIPLLSACTLFHLGHALRGIRRGEVEKRAADMRSALLHVLIGAGACTLLPGRIMHEVVFGQ